MSNTKNYGPFKGVWIEDRWFYARVNFDTKNNWGYWDIKETA